VFNRSTLKMNAFAGCSKSALPSLGAQNPSSLDEVEPAADIVRRFSTGANVIRLDSAARRISDACCCHETDRRAKSNTG